MPKAVKHAASVLLLVVPCLCFLAGEAYAMQQKPTRVQPIYTEFFGPPPSLAEMTAAAAAVVRVRLEHATAHDRILPNEPGPRVMTRYTGTILEVVKNDAEASLLRGGHIEILREGGQRDRGSYIEEVVQQGFPMFQAGEYVLFLRWQHAYESWVPAFGPEAAFEIHGQKVVSLGSAPIARSQNGRPVSDFMQELREAAILPK